MEHQQSIGQYRLIKKLGEGKLTSVYLVQKEDKLYSMRVQSKQDSDVQMCKLSQAFVKEISAFKRVKHPFIIEMVDSFIWRDEGQTARWCMVFEQAEGGDLYGRIIEKKEKASEKHAINWFAQVCLAVEHLLRVGIEPFTIMQQTIVIVGKQIEIAKIGGMGFIEEGYFGMNDVLVCPSRYYAPESFQGEHSAKIVTWSLGVVLFEIFSGGEHPFQANFDGKTYLSNLHRFEIRLNHVISGNSKELLKLLLEKDPSKRASMLQNPLVKDKIDILIKSNLLNERDEVAIKKQYSDINEHQDISQVEEEKQPQAMIRHGFEEEKLKEFIPKDKG
ncbi:hypothetical protein FGO68_gene14874 [Halteria grandinella]|uniref:Protein kinase domain-containing protein n=1 Tax=Halteria grandinella TaxID=5974 RepID=A0A8J8NSN7_HALGN|nr:hypothetical protein FGO68_gene14874 [Halteria grandinella]